MNERKRIPDTPALGKKGGKLHSKRVPLVAGNWKMNTTLVQATSLARNMLGELDGVNGVEKVLCPPFISLAAVHEVLRGSSVKLGAQNMHFEEKGAYTGEVSPAMLAGLCEFVILGHSERRQHFGETDQIVNKKMVLALKNKLRPILCIGERLEDKKSGKTEEIIAGQIAGGLDSVDATREIVIAYEPVWAIGTGISASGEKAAATIGFIRHAVGRLWNSNVAQDLVVLYGGSVTGSNIAEFISYPEIDGALVGGASLQPSEFVSIVSQTAAIKGGSAGS